MTHIIHTNFDDKHNEMKIRALENLAKILREGSGWPLHSITKLVIQATRYEPLVGNKYTTPLPKRHIGKRAIANMKNDDNECLKWAVTRALHPVARDPARITKELIQTRDPRIVQSFKSKCKIYSVL